MDTWTFGWTVALIGMGGTMLVLWLLSLLILVLKKLFPYKAEESGSAKG
ncbi:MAG: OadG-related small transporter subunit [Candidatus Binatia bacterium]